MSGYDSRRVLDLIHDQPFRKKDASVQLYCQEQTIDERKTTRSDFHGRSVFCALMLLPFVVAIFAPVRVTQFINRFWLLFNARRVAVSHQNFDGLLFLRARNGEKHYTTFEA